MKLKWPLFEMGVGMLEIIAIGILTIFAGHSYGFQIHFWDDSRKCDWYESMGGVELRTVTPLHPLTCHKKSTFWKCVVRQVWESQS